MERLLNAFEVMVEEDRKFTVKFTAQTKMISSGSKKSHREFQLVTGVVVFWIGYSDLQQYGGLLGQIAQSLSQEIQSKVAQDQYTAVSGGIAAIIGLALTVFGLAANRK